ncbi:hypothetical protein H696_00585 [Fonticula alba]|uniref:Uncharacterized protein n=1 Tax=Fonticula alba TaxID=691883 RepID=A0A058ZHR1_FONAL|nr:hypothetical protein H696_00585 [Fonticula alba]KCV73037.1 hypothetical protein H696_00585 [Fonticula alba]|eukprot:XP_009492738.1 hypothetical protein H696_00585 [Fonticula alba]
MTLPYYTRPWPLLAHFVAYAAFTYYVLLQPVPDQQPSGAGRGERMHQNRTSLAVGPCVGTVVPLPLADLLAERIAREIRLLAEPPAAGAAPPKDPPAAGDMSCYLVDARSDSVGSGCAGRRRPAQGPGRGPTRVGHWQLP